MVVDAHAVARLNDRQALWTVDYVGRVMATLSGVAPNVLARQIRAGATAGLEAIPGFAPGEAPLDPEAAAHAAVIARYALTQGLTDEREELRHAVTTAVTEANEPDVTKSLVALVIVGGLVLVGLAFLAKLEYRDGKLVLNPGLPGIKDAGAAVGSLVHAALGGKAAGGAGS